MDKWCLSRLNTMVKTVDDCLANYKVTESAKALQAFVEELSNWYVRRCRARFWAKGMEQDKINAYMTLYTALVTLSKVAAPLVPFITENIYRNLVCSVDKSAPESVHLCDYPKFDESFIDADLERDMELVLEIVTLGRAARNETNIKNRQPLAEMFVNVPSKLSDFFVDIIADELNVKKVEFKDDMSEFINYVIKPNFRNLGKKVGKLMPQVKAALDKIDAAAAKAQLDKNGEFELNAGGETVKLTAEDVEINVTQAEAFNTQKSGEVTIALSTTLSSKLIEEGYVREIISKVQTMRRDSNFEVMDHIILTASGNDKLIDIIKRNEAEIKQIVLAEKVEYNQAADNTKDWSINGEDISLAVRII